MKTRHPMKQGHGVSLLRFSSRIFALILLRVRGSSGSHEATPPMEPSSGLRLCTSKKASKSHPPSSLTGPGMSLVQLPGPPPLSAFRGWQLCSAMRVEVAGGRSRQLSFLHFSTNSGLVLHHNSCSTTQLFAPTHWFNPSTPSPLTQRPSR